MPPSILDAEREGDAVAAAINVADSGNGAVADKNKNRQIILIESRPLVQWCLSRWLEEDFDSFQLVTFSSPTEAAPQLNNDRSVDLIIWSIGDLALSQLSAFQDLERVKATFPKVPIVLLADREGRRRCRRSHSAWCKRLYTHQSRQEGNRGDSSICTTGRHVRAGKHHSGYALTEAG